MKITSYITLFLYIICWSCLTFAEHPIHPRIGVITPQSGPIAEIGQYISNSIKLAQAAFDPENQVSFIYEDDGFIPKNTASIAQKLLNLDKVSALIVFGSSTSMAVASIAEQAKVPFIAIALSEKITEGKQYVFRHFYSPKEANIKIMEEVKRQQYKSIAVITTTQDGMLSLRNHFIGFKDMPVVFDEEVLPGESDLRTLATKMIGVNPDAVYVLLLPPQASIFSKMLRQFGYKGEFFGGPQIGNEGEVKASQGALVGAWYVTADDSNAQSFYDEYKNKYGVLPVSEAAQAYDTAKILIEGANQPSIIDYLKSKRRFTGVFGTYSLDQKEGAFQIGAMVKRITEKGFERQFITN